MYFGCLFSLESKKVNPYDSGLGSPKTSKLEPFKSTDAKPLIVPTSFGCGGVQYASKRFTRAEPFVGDPRFKAVNSFCHPPKWTNCSRVFAATRILREQNNQNDVPIDASGQFVLITHVKCGIPQVRHLMGKAPHVNFLDRRVAH